MQAPVTLGIHVFYPSGALPRIQHNMQQILSIHFSTQTVLKLIDQSSILSSTNSDAALGTWTQLAAACAHLQVAVDKGDGAYQSELGDLAPGASVEVSSCGQTPLHECATIHAAFGIP